MSDVNLQGSFTTFASFWISFHNAPDCNLQFALPAGLLGSLQNGSRSGFSATTYVLNRSVPSPPCSRVISSRTRMQAGWAQSFGAQTLPIAHVCPAAVLQSLSTLQERVGSYRQILASPKYSEWSVIAAKSSARPFGS